MKQNILIAAIERMPSQSAGQPGQAQLSGIIFDMDGVLVDSEPVICEAGIRMLAEKGVKATPEDFRPFVGMGENRYLSGAAGRHGLVLDIEKDKARTYEIYFELIRAGLNPLPGVHEFIARVRRRGLKTALATSADRCKADANLAAIRLPPENFDAIIASEDAVHKKPAPDIFLAAARKLALAPARCLVVEDAPSGVAAAKAAGARCLALTTTFEAARLTGADWFAPHLGQVPEEALAW
ncbi:MAG: HAD-IA family hydrolase [Candidatus Sumerlaeota bacterium]|nr:HAD-IA family hydrolase [Candidatus Sumerlaeota bacterium]